MTDRKTTLDATAMSILVGCCFLWGLNNVAVKVAIPEVPVLWQAAARSVGGSLLVWAWARWRGIALFARDGTLPGGLLAGGLFAAEFLCIFVGLQYTTASRMAVFIYCSPFVVALGMPFIARSEKLAPAQWAGLVAGFGGVVLAFSEGFAAPAAGPQQWIGDALGITAGVLWGATTLAIRGTKLSSAPAEKMLFCQLAVSAVVLVAVALLAGARLPQAVSALTGASLFFQVVIVVSGSYLLWFWLIRHYPATRLASFTLLTPVFGLALGALLLDDPVTPRLLVALAAVASGIWLVNRR
jgi:drug/metabolite transporter (DMT)-like permease